MAEKPLYNESSKPPDQQPIGEPVGDGFPAEKDISVPPPGADQEDGDDPDRPSSAKDDPQ